MEENIYYLDVVGYNDYLQRISALEEELKSFLATRSTEAKDILLDEHYSSATSCDLVRREKLILDNLQDLQKKKRSNKNYWKTRRRYKSRYRWQIVIRNNVSIPKYRRIRNWINSNYRNIT